MPQKPEKKKWEKNGSKNLRTASQTEAEWPELNPISQMVLTAGMRASATCILRSR